MRRGSVKHAKGKREQERQVREAKMHSIPFVKMENQEPLSLHLFCHSCLGANKLLILHYPSENVTGLALHTCRLPRYQDGHAWLAREKRKDPVDVDTDRGSMGWINWDLAGSAAATVKTEPHVFSNLYGLTLVMSSSWTHLLQRSANSLPSTSMLPPMNPTDAMLGLANATEGMEDDLEQLLEAEMDLMHADFRDIGQAPEDDL